MNTDKKAEKKLEQAKLKAAVAAKKEDPPLLVAAKYLRNLRKRPLVVADGIIDGRRMQFFLGCDFIDMLCDGRVKDYECDDDEKKAMGVGNQMLRAGYIARVETVDRPRRDRPNEMKFHEEQIMCARDVDTAYMWLIEPSSTRLLMQSVGLICFCLFITCIHIWPLWLKIAVWWCSLIMLISMTSIMLVRLVVTACVWVVGFRGIWMLPNLFDDDIDVLEAFSPLFGIGQREEARLQRKRDRERTERRAARAQRRADRKQARAAGEEVQGDDEPDTDSEDEAVEAAAVAAKAAAEHKFGLVNLAVILFMGLVLCRQLGVFKGENIPDFLVTRDELWKQFPSLAYDIDNTAGRDLDAEAAEAAAAAAAEAQREADDAEAIIDKVMADMAEADEDEE